MNEARKIFKNRIHFSEDEYEALRGADALAVVTEWSEFRTPDFQKIKKLMKKPLIFDGRNIYNQAELRKWDSPITASEERNNIIGHGAKSIERRVKER